MLLQATADRLNAYVTDEHGPSGWLFVRDAQRFEIDAVPFTVLLLPGRCGRWTVDFPKTTHHLLGNHGIGGRVSVAREVDRP